MSGTVRFLVLHLHVVLRGPEGLSKFHHDWSPRKIELLVCVSPEKPANTNDLVY